MFLSAHLLTFSLGVSTGWGGGCGTINWTDWGRLGIKGIDNFLPRAWPREASLREATVKHGADVVGEQCQRGVSGWMGSITG